jgi:acyl-CoA reductase-like NAD-dependent aldehyde dehydrogenase
MYLRRAAQAVLDELDRLALLIARETGRPRSEALLAELLPSVSALHSLADDGPRALADQRLGRPPLLRAGRRAVLVQAPAGVVAVCGRTASPWAEPLLEAAASLLAGNGVLLVPAASLVGERIAAAFIRAGVPGDLIAVVHDGLPGDDVDRVVDLGEDDDKATMLVLAGAPLDATVSGALWAAFAGAGRHPAAVGRLVAAPGPAEPLLERLVAGALRLRVGDPEHADTEVGPLASHADLEAVERLVVEAEAGGAERLCGGPLTLPGLDGAFCAPIVLRGVPHDARLLRELPPGPVLAVLEAASESEAVRLAAAHADAPVSVWTDDRRHASQPARVRSARWLPYDPALVAARTAAARLLHGRESERVAALRAGALPMARTAWRQLKRSGSKGSSSIGDGSPQ